MAQQRFRTLDEFWPYYVGEHRNRLTRRFHFIAMTNLAVWLVVAVMLRRLRPAIMGIITSYAFAWFGHMVFERNQPDTFQYPLLSLLADMRMYDKMRHHEMDSEVERITGGSQDERHIII